VSALLICSYASSAQAGFNSDLLIDSATHYSTSLHESVPDLLAFHPFVVHLASGDFVTRPNILPYFVLHFDSNEHSFIQSFDASINSNSTYALPFMQALTLTGAVYPDTLNLSFDILASGAYTASLGFTRGFGATVVQDNGARIYYSSYEADFTLTSHGNNPSLFGYSFSSNELLQAILNTGDAFSVAYRESYANGMDVLTVPTSYSGEYWQGAGRLVSTLAVPEPVPAALILLGLFAGSLLCGRRHWIALISMLRIGIRLSTP